jgi:hypothetical protein
VSEFLLPTETLDLPRLSQLWSWLVPPDHRVIALSAFGDGFFEDPAGAVHMVDTMEGEIRPVARSRDEFLRRAAERAFADEVLLADWVRILRERGIGIAKGQCYGWKVMPILGAPMTAENIGVFDAMTYQVITSTFLKEIKKLPPGTPVSKFLIDGKEP